MKYLIMLSHGQFAEGTRQTLVMFAGDAKDRIFALDLTHGDTQYDFQKKVQSFLDQHKFANDDEFLVLADMIGGSPLKTFKQVMKENGLADHLIAIGGLNLPMALNAAVNLNVLTLNELAAQCLSKGQAAVKADK